MERKFPNIELVKKKIEFNLEMIEIWEHDRKNDEEGSDAYYRGSGTIANHYFILGQCKYLIGEITEAIDHFRNAAFNFSIFNNFDPWGQIASGISGGIPVNWIGATILSSDSNLRASCGKELLANVYKDEREFNPFHNEALTLSNYLVSNIEEVKRLLPILENHEEKAYKSDWWRGPGIYVGKAKMMKGIIETNYNELLEGCIAGLVDFSNHYKRKETLPLCIDVQKYLILGKEKDIVIKEVDLKEKYSKFIFNYFKS